MTRDEATTRKPRRCYAGEAAVAILLGLPIGVGLFWAWATNYGKSDPSWEDFLYLPGLVFGVCLGLGFAVVWIVLALRRGRVLKTIETAVSVILIFAIVGFGIWGVLMLLFSDDILGEALRPAIGEGLMKFFGR